MKSENCVVAVLGLIVYVIVFSSDVRGQVLNLTKCGDSVTVHWSPWSPWSAGSASCSTSCVGQQGETTRQRVRECPVAVDSCLDVQQQEVEYYACAGTLQPVTGGYGPWSDWASEAEDCSVLCGTGTNNQTRSRQCDSPAPVCGGTDCSGQGVGVEIRQGISCSPGRCGAICPDLSPPMVLPFASLAGYYRLCIWGAVQLLPCPSPEDTGAFFRYGSRNGILLYNICMYGPRAK